MRRPPPLQELIHNPVTGAIGIAAFAAMLGRTTGGDIGRFVMDTHTFHGEPWRILTSAILHGDWIHLAFNLYWLWVFGTLVERTLGSLAMFGLFLYLAVTSGLAEWTFSDGGIGLSGVGYGLFGMLWVLHSRDPRFAEAIDRQTILLFVAWFFFCIVATVTDLMPIGNVAHAAGCAAGALAGLALLRDKPRRLAGIVFAPVLLVLVLLGATYGRPLLNLSSHAGQDSAWLGYRALEENQNTEALEWYQEALELNPDNSAWWFNRGVALSRLSAAAQQAQDTRRLLKEAYRCYQKALSLEPDSQRYRSAVEDTRAYMLAAGWSDIHR